MSAVCAVADDTDLLALVSGPAHFETIAKDDVDGVIWRRTAPTHFQQWIDQLPADCLPSTRAVFATAHIDRCVREIVENSNMPACDHRFWFVEDVAMIANAFADAMSTTYMRLRFDVVFNNGCPKFHRDNVKARLLCAYRGLGTQYGLMDDGDEPEPIFTAPTSAPIVLRGNRWPTEKGRPLRHRSPPIAGSLAPRLVLALDPLTELPGDQGYDTIMA